MEEKRSFSEENAVFVGKATLFPAVYVKHGLGPIKRILCTELEPSKKEPELKIKPI